MFKKLSKKKGFTLMEMMIVVAIIAVLIAIIIPTFTSALARAHAATDEANLRAYYAEQMANSVLNNNSNPDGITGNKFKVGGVEYTLYGSVKTTVTGGQLTISYTGPDGSGVGTITIPGGGNTGATKGG